MIFIKCFYGNNNMPAPFGAPPGTPLPGMIHHQQSAAGYVPNPTAMSYPQQPGYGVPNQQAYPAQYHHHAPGMNVYPVAGHATYPANSGVHHGHHGHHEHHGHNYGHHMHPSVVPGVFSKKEQKKREKAAKKQWKVR